MHVLAKQQHLLAKSSFGIPYTMYEFCKCLTSKYTYYYYMGFFTNVEMFSFATRFLFPVREGEVVRFLKLPAAQGTQCGPNFRTTTSSDVNKLTYSRPERTIRLPRISLSHELKWTWSNFWMKVVFLYNSDNSPWTYSKILPWMSSYFLSCQSALRARTCYPAVGNCGQSSECP